MNDTHELIQNKNGIREMEVEIICELEVSILIYAMVVRDSEYNVSEIFSWASVCGEGLKEDDKWARDFEVFSLELLVEIFNKEGLLVGDRATNSLVLEDRVEGEDTKVQLGNKGMPISICVSKTFGVNHLSVHKGQNVVELNKAGHDECCFIVFDTVEGKVGDTREKH